MKLKQHHKTVLGMAAVCVDLIQLERNVYGHFPMRGDFDASLHTVQKCVAGMVHQYLHDHHDRVVDYLDGLLGNALYCAPVAFDTIRDQLESSVRNMQNAYMARHIAKNIVANGLATACEIQIAYAIGVVEPVGLYVDAKGTSTLSNEQLEEWVRRWFDLTPAGIIKYLDLLNTTYYPVAAYGHFGVNAATKPWERVVTL